MTPAINKTLQFLSIWLPHMKIFIIAYFYTLLCLHYFIIFITFIVFYLHKKSGIVLTIPDMSLQLFSRMFNSGFTIYLATDKVPIHHHFNKILRVALEDFCQNHLIHLFITFITRSLQFQFKRNINAFLLFHHKKS